MSGRDDSMTDLRHHVTALEDEISVLRRRLAESPRPSRGLEDQVTELQHGLAKVTTQNERLVGTLREATDQIVALKEEIDRLTQPPAGFGVFMQRNDDDSIDVFTNGRKLRVSLSPAVAAEELRRGQEVLLNEDMNIVAALSFKTVGEVVTLREILPDGERAIVQEHTDNEMLVRLADPLRDEPLRVGEALLVDPRSGWAYERVPRAEVTELVLEEVPGVAFSDIGGLDPQISAIRNAIELPYIHRDQFETYELKPPKGVLLWGPPGCGKTLIAKAVATSLAQKVALVTGKPQGKSYFISIKGPELLNKYVGETERHIRLVFQRAREKASMGAPVIIFFDEMDSLFRTRGSGVSSDVENTIVPQLLSEMDGIESLENVIVIGASNREELIDSAILRPGRLGLKIRVDRPDAAGAKEIFRKYVKTTLPIDAHELEVYGSRELAVAAIVESTVRKIYQVDRDNEFAEVTYEGGEVETLYIQDFISGAVIQSVVDRAKLLSLLRKLLTSADNSPYEGLCATDLVEAARAEFRENQMLTGAANADDWMRIAGRKGKRIVFARTLFEGAGRQGRALDI